MYVPELRTNLLSVMKAAEKGRKVTFVNNYTKILNTEENPIVYAQKLGNLYYVRENREQETAMFALFSNDLLLWHMRYGHLNENDLKKLVRMDMVKGLFKSKGEMPFCDICVKCKQTVLPFKASTNKKVVKTLDLVHSDVCGPMQTLSNGGSRYFITFIDECTNWVEVYFLKSKAEAKEAFQKYRAKVEKQTERKIKCLRTDNGLEYCSKDFDRMLEANGIRREKSSAYTPQQNGTAERMNRTLVDIARSMLHSSTLLKGFWAEAVSTAAYLRNRCPSKKLDSNTPFECWYGYKPNVSYFKTFGCKAFMLLKRPGRDKFEPRAKECIFIGYSRESKAYRLWDPKKRKV